MALSVPPPDPTLDPVTGLPVGADYFTQYQIPLNSQPVNLTELNAQGRQNNWLYPDHIPPTLARLQARDLTNEGNAQDLSTDGQRNLNVNIAKSSIPSGGGGSGTPYDQLFNGSRAIPSDSNGHSLFATDTTLKTIHAIQWSLCLAGSDPIIAQNQVLLEVKAVPSSFVSSALFAVVYPDSAPSGYQMQSQSNGFLSFPNGGFKLDFQLPTDSQFQFQARNSIGTDIWMYIVVYGSTT